MSDQQNEMIWIDELPETDRTRDSRFRRFIEELQKNPNTWALWKIMPEGRSWSSTTAYTRNYPQSLIFSQRKVNGRNEVYAQWVTTDLYALGLNTRITNCLKRLGCQTIDDVCQYSHGDLLYLNHMGEKSIAQLQEKLESIGRSLSDIDHSVQEMQSRVWGRFRQQNGDNDE